MTARAVVRATRGRPTDEGPSGPAGDGRANPAGEGLPGPTGDGRSYVTAACDTLTAVRLAHGARLLHTVARDRTDG